MGNKEIERKPPDKEMELFEKRRYRGYRRTGKDYPDFLYEIADIVVDQYMAEPA